MNNNDNIQYLLAALIEIYRGQAVPLPETEPDREKIIMLDVFSSAMSFARSDDSRRILSEDIFRCNKEGATVREEMERVKSQPPDVLNAKMIAAAHMMNVLNPSQLKFS
ncbi:MAG: hypothetical protein ACOY46_06825 [Bacillota bacterium]